MESMASICNLALNKIGNTNHIDTLEETTEEARVCKSLWQHAVTSTLELVKPQFATRRATLVATPDARTNWLYTYALPEDCVAVKCLIIEGMEIPPMSARFPWDTEADVKGEARVLLTNLNPVEVKYISDFTVDQPVRFPELFIEALTWHLASNLALALKKDIVLSRECRNEYKEAVREAAAAEHSQRDESPNVPTTPSLAARGGIDVDDYRADKLR